MKFSIRVVRGAPAPKLALLSTAILVIILVVGGASAAGGPPGGGFVSGQTIQNVGTVQSAVTVTLYDSATTNTYSKAWDVGPGAATTFFVSDVLSAYPGAPASLMASAVVTSTQPVKAVVNVTNRKDSHGGVDGGTAAAEYRSVDEVSTGMTLGFPLAKQNFYNKTSAFYIQNAGDAPATASATFLMGTSLTDPNPVAYPFTTPSIGVGQMVVIFAGDASVPAGTIGSLTVTSLEPLAGVIQEYETSTVPALILQSTTGFTPGDFDGRILFPVVKKKLFGRSTGLQIQNVDDVDVNVTLTYKGSSASAACPATFTATELVRTLKPKQSTTYLESSLLPLECLASAEAAATETLNPSAAGMIAGLVNESFQPCTTGCTQRATMYAAFPAKAATTKLVAPVFKQDLFNKRTGLSIQNVSDIEATATVTFTVGTTNYVYNNLVIPGKQAALLNNLASTTAYPDANWTGGVRLPNGSLAAVTATATQQIIGILNEAPLAGVVQDNINYEAFNVTP